ncbi:hypothetical protein NX722_28395 [Endozoicomonas gorgoniicola]|uniref:Uncharacterized protein n=1 Tax=Endozoicomonas gorgoniicola TaxID=1234144 RepID=A0ABT3N4D4_9GAMM|nr:hypothetical protein [Endozoicomonas gorgoniicola]MCW7556487.1 hypothetical protein [Endozoicomonas gorgoniicola]
MSSPANAPIEMIRGDTLAVPITFKDPANNDNAVPVNGYTLTFTVKVSRYMPDDEASIQKNIVLPSSASNGEYTLIIDPADTNDLEPMSYDYDIQIKSPDGKTVVTVVQAKLKLLMGTTHS